MEKISKATAQKIVETVKEVCGCNVNFIEGKGRIIASTNQKRVGDFHEGGRLAAQRNETLEVFQDGQFPGARKGVNIPVCYQGRPVAVVGISGEPEEVRRFGRLAVRITDLILRERELYYLRGSRRQADLDYLVRSAVFSQERTKEYKAYAAEQFHIGRNTLYRTLVLSLASRENFGISEQTEQKILKVLEQTGTEFHTFCYPEEYILILSENGWIRNRSVFQNLAIDLKGTVRMGLGKAAPFWSQNISYQQARLAAESAGALRAVADFERLDLELLLGEIRRETREAFLEKTIGELAPEDLELLKVYFQEDMSLQNTSSRLFLHKNSLQYKLNRIGRLCGYNPRSFRQAAVLYMSLKLMENEEDRKNR